MEINISSEFLLLTTVDTRYLWVVLCLAVSRDNQTTKHRPASAEWTDPCAPCVHRQPLKTWETVMDQHRTFSSHQHHPQHLHHAQQTPTVPQSYYGHLFQLQWPWRSLCFTDVSFFLNTLSPAYVHWLQDTAECHKTYTTTFSRATWQYNVIQGHRTGSTLHWQIISSLNFMEDSKNRLTDVISENSPIQPQIICAK